MITVAEVKKLQDDVPIIDFEVQVVKVFGAEKLAGFEGRGFNFKQNILFKDVTGEIYGQLVIPLMKDLDEFGNEMETWNEKQEDYKLFKKEMEGKRIVLSAFHSEKHGWVGCKKGSYKSKKDGSIIPYIKMTSLVQIKELTNDATIAPEGAETGKTGLGPQELYWEVKEKRGIRERLTSYAKDLCVAGLLKIEEIDDWVNGRFKNICNFEIEVNNEK